MQLRDYERRFGIMFNSCTRGFSGGKEGEGSKEIEYQHTRVDLSGTK